MKRRALIAGAGALPLVSVIRPASAQLREMRMVESGGKSGDWRADP